MSRRAILPEQWKQIEDWPAYEVSNQGRVRRGGKILKGVPVQSGSKASYAPLRVSLSDGVARVKGFRIAQLVLEAFVGPRPVKAIIRHLDDDQANNWAGNLRWGTHAENGADRIVNGLSCIGETNGNSSLNSEQVLAIRARYFNHGWNKTNIYELCTEFGVKRHTITNIVQRKTWKHI